MTFKLEIELGNDAMQTGEDIARALNLLVDRIPGRVRDGDYGSIRDENGNTVGSWKVVSD